MLTTEEYDRWAQPYHEAIFRTATGVPRVLFVKECPYLERMTRTGAEVISLGTSHNLAEARQAYPHLVFQGNVDEAILRTGTPAMVEAEVRRCLRDGGGHRHIVNLNHGVGKETPVANSEAYIQTVKAGLDG
jgi:uroporphyrinogen decarboxylase